MNKPMHGLGNRGLEAGANPGLGHGRFGRMFDRPASPVVLPEALVEKIADAMTFKMDAGKPITRREPLDENHTVPAGYTYFGQFIDHDITFDPTPLTAKTNDVEALEDFRTPALDLDCVYGSGPDAQPYLYQGVRLRVGRSPGNGAAAVGTLNDLYRLPAADGSVPLIGDKRNDENKIVSQLHGVFIAFHNKIVVQDDLLRRVAPFIRKLGNEFDLGDELTNDTVRFRAAAAIVRWHYQWLVLNDFLPRVLYPGVLDTVLNRRGTMPLLPHYLKCDAPYAYMPVEFAAAAYRFGHSMVRPSYALNKDVFELEGDTTHQSRIPIFVPGQPTDQNGFRLSLNGFPGPLPDRWGIDWGYFFDHIPATRPPLEPGQTEDSDGFKTPQSSYRLDALLAHPLAALPEFAKLQANPFKNLAFRNLIRGQQLELPSGESVADALGLSQELRIPADQIWSAGSLLAGSRPPQDAGDVQELKDTAEKRQAVFAGAEESLRHKTPLWFYILREGEYFGVTHDPGDPLIAAGGQHLGPVGSRIVAETFVGLLWKDRGSFLHRMPGFRPFPEFAPAARPFELADLITYALT